MDVNVLGKTTRVVVTFRLCIPKGCGRSDTDMNQSSTFVVWQPLTVSFLSLQSFITSSMNLFVLEAIKVLITRIVHYSEASQQSEDCPVFKTIISSWFSLVPRLHRGIEQSIYYSLIFQVSLLL